MHSFDRLRSKAVRFHFRSRKQPIPNDEKKSTTTSIAYHSPTESQTPLAITSWPQSASMSGQCSSYTLRSEEHKSQTTSRLHLG